jgi:hypothetical protein
MENIEFTSLPDYRAKTYTKEDPPCPSCQDGGTFFYSHEIHHPYVLKTADELPLAFFLPKRGIFGGIVLTPKDSLEEKLFRDFKTFLDQIKAKPEEVYFCFGPSLTFSHVVIDRPTLLKIMDLGYRGAAKRTSGLDFFDVPMMNFLQLRKLGVPAANITLDAHDTFEDDALLYSHSRGDKENNLTLIERLR